MTNATIRKFGHPATLVAEYEHWVVLLRPAAITLGSLVLASRCDATAYGDLPAAAYVEQGAVIRAIEAALTRFVSYEKINYLMLMMVDPHVHLHVIPRYSGMREHNDRTFTDGGWPGMPDLAGARPLASDEIASMTWELRSVWPG